MAGTEVATQTRSEKLSVFLDSRADDFKMVQTVDSEKFLRVVKNAVLRDPLIAEASSKSVYLECMKAMNDGLVLDGREAALTRFNTSRKNPQTNQWEKIVEVVYIPMVAGIMKRVRASGEIKSWTVELVYQEEYEQGRFKYRAAPDPIIEHDPIIVGKRGPVVAAYSAVKLADGSHHYEVMTIDQLNAIKARTKSKKTEKVNNQDVVKITGPWATDEEEMFRKTVIRRHSKRLPVSSSTMDVAQRVDSLYDDADVIEHDELPTAAPAPVKKSNAASRLKKAAAAQPKPEEKEEASDPETGEILEGEIILSDDEDGEAGEGSGTVNPEDEF